ncbi:hypothetical protein PSACC_02593 [Paramicrosporidium saccamoebae]|uniref:Uncharacterized protein n=1 Tax=Paramicrosporidium saccamoebae TaxID=1246581 RepID=A0A2H9TIN5_9FUNG|nr:hypothetical protein PSACC_02593 [Paramicrosporidium saccamoebae]
MELLDPTDLNSISLWQCCLKVLAKNPTIGDDIRVCALTLLLKHCATVSKNSQLFDLGKWFQFVRASLKLNKYSLKRIKIPHSSLADIVAIIQTQPDGSLVADLLSLPFRSGPDCPVPADLGESLRPIVKNEHYAPGTVGGALLNTKTKAMDVDSASGVRQSKSYSVVQLGFWMNLCTTLWSVKEEQKSLRIAKTLAALVAQHSFQPEQNWELLLLRIVLKKLLSRSRIKDLVKESFRDSLDLILKMHTESADLDDRLFYWPLAAATNFCTEFPQPTSCRELRATVKTVLERAKCPRLIALCGRALRLSLKYFEPIETPDLLNCIEKLPPFISMSLISSAALVPSLDFTDSKWKELLQTTLLKCCPPNTRASVSFLRDCEIYLRFASDLSVFENPSLAHLQTDLVSFLQREGGSVQFDQLAVREKEGTRWRSKISLQIPLVDEVEVLLRKLEDCLKCLGDRPEVTNLIQKYMK